MGEQATGCVMPRVVTIGHSTRDFEEVLHMLRANGVTELVDVRSYPCSRKFPQWNRAAIQKALHTDIGYPWIAALGADGAPPRGMHSQRGREVHGFSGLCRLHGDRSVPIRARGPGADR